MIEREVTVVQSVHRALQLLNMFAPHRTHAVPHRKRWSVSDLARATGLHKSIVARMMATMALEGYVVQDPVTRQYSIGPQAFAVGYSYEPYAVLNSVARPVMEDLTARCGHASYLGVAAGAYYVCLLAVESRRSIRVNIDVGERRTYHSGAIGKVLLAEKSDAAVRELVGPEPLPQLTPHTITLHAELLAQLAEVRRTGIAYNRQESIPGSESIAVGIRNASGDCVAGIGIIYPNHVVNEPELQELTRQVIAAGETLSQRLAALPPDGLLPPIDR